MFNIRKKTIQDNTSRFFAKCNGLSIEHYQLSNYANVSDHSEKVDLTVNPFYHYYFHVSDETVVNNSHGTDIDRYHYEKLLTPAEAVKMIRKTDPHHARAIDEYEKSCLIAYEQCSYLIKENLPDCEPQGLIYNSGTCTLMRVQNPDGRESAVKISRIAEEDYENIRSFYDGLNSIGGCPNIVGLEQLVKLPGDPLETAGRKESIIIIKMPLLTPAFIGVKTDSSDRIQYAGIKKKHIDSVFYYQAGLAMAKALAAIHSMGYVHHDIRPENLLIDHDNKLILGDLCSIRPLAAQYQGHMQGSSQFQSPELIHHKPYGTDSDVYAWGRSILFLLTFLPSSDNSFRKVDLKKIESRFSYYELHFDGKKVCTLSGGSVLVPLVKAAIKAVSEDPLQRYHDGSELLAAIERV